MRPTLVAICLFAVCFPTYAGASDSFTVVLHARTPSGSGQCAANGLPNCSNLRPVTQIDVQADFRLYVFLYHYNSIQAFQAAFDWPGDWSIDGQPVVLGCRSNQLNAAEPSNPGGAMSGTLATAFDCFQGPSLVSVARLDFQAGASGCLTLVNPTQGTRRVEIVDCQGQSYVIDAGDPDGRTRLGTICVGTNGVDSCDLPGVEPSNWGRIKASFR